MAATRQEHSSGIDLDSVLCYNALSGLSLGDLLIGESLTVAEVNLCGDGWKGFYCLYVFVSLSLSLCLSLLEF